ncbi:hypothetical protein ALC53_07191 [Atta colombica]|uniref:MADF domain-containing protein n=1 Tax=Atta colombica TaxID=520822 RepID=A0A195BCW7_9HYME|nr:hypothetical protein ALC53_07191 [Atta colombica]
MRESVRENSRRSISHRSQELGLFATSIWRILRIFRDLGLHPYKIQLTQELKVNNHRQHRVFAYWVLEQLEVNPNFAKQIIFSDKTHFQKKTLWQKVLNMMRGQLSAENAKNRWKYLRDCYMKAKKKQQTYIPSSSGTIPKKKIHFTFLSK